MVRYARWANAAILRHRATRLSGAAALLLPMMAQAYDVDETLSIGGVLAGAYQYQFLDRGDGREDEGGGAVPFQPELSFRPTQRDELFVKLGFAAGNGLNDKTSFTLGPWAADLQDDVKDINGRGRNYLLGAWYKHTFEFGPEHGLGVTGGIIDAADYLDDNAYANDEYTQFMNEALVNAGAFFPSYDTGGAVEWARGKLGVRGVVMHVGENDDGRSFQFYGAQIGYTVETPLGEGTYRVIVDATSRDFLDPSGLGEERRRAALLSFDQQLGDRLGGFLRLGWQDDGAAVDFDAIYSGGLDLSGKLWGRSEDNIGIAYAYVNGGNTGIDHTHVFESYLRVVFSGNFAVTADLQYMDESLEVGAGPRGWIPGVRFSVHF